MTTRETKRERMYARIKAHGEALGKYYGNGQAQDPVKLCKSLLRIERKLHQVATDLCNGDVESSSWESVCAWATPRILKLLPNLYKGDLRFNPDARGYALKIESGNVPPGVHQDMGGYGILAPTFDGEE